MVFKAATGNYENDFGGLAQITVLDRFEAEAREIAGEERFSDFERQSGPIGEPNRFAQYLLPLVPIAVMFVRRAPTRVGATPFAVAGVLVLAGIMLTFSRGAFLGLLVSALVMIAVRLVKFGYLVVGIAVLAAFLVVAPSYRDRILSIEGVSTVLSQENGATDSSVEGRFTENAAAIAAFIDHPIAGVGPGNFSLHYRDYADVAPANVRSGERAAHNLYLGVAAETGVLGLIAVLGVFAVTLRELLRGLKRSDDAAGKMIAASFVVAVIGLMVTGVFLHFAFIRYFWLFMALAAAAAKVALPEGGGQPARAIGRVFAPAGAG
jgi:O-antigen ligase